MELKNMQMILMRKEELKDSKLGRTKKFIIIIVFFPLLKIFHIHNIFSKISTILFNFVLSIYIYLISRELELLFPHLNSKHEKKMKTYLQLTPNFTLCPSCVFYKT